MKKNLFISSLVIFFSIISPAVFAQVEQESATTAVHTPKWASKKGYWVVESNLHNPASSRLYFYNNDNVLLYTEDVEGMVINISKRRTKMKLKKVLEQSVVLYAQRKKAGENEMLVINTIRKHK